jgi:NADH-quinone oxidoreductase subunit N
MSIPVPAINISAILPEIVLVTTAFIIILVDLFLPKKWGLSIPIICFVGLLVGFYSLATLWGDTLFGFGDTVISDNFALFFKFIFLLGALLVSLISIDYLKREGIYRAEYFFLILISTVGMMIMASSIDLVSIFLGLEVMSIALYVLAGFNRLDPRSNEASLKYFLIGAFASGFLLYGIALVYGNFHTTNLKEIFTLLSGEYSLSILGLAGVVLVLMGFSFKVAFVPFHMWVPDVYHGAPTSATAFMSAGPKAAGFAVLLRTVTYAFNLSSPELTPLFWILAVLTMSLGNIVAIVQNDIKRMLAYSSIAHAGYVLVAVVAGGPGGTSAAMFYLLVYTLMNVGAFTILIVFGRRGEDNLKLSDYAGLAGRYPLGALAMTLFMLSLAGIPPTAGFMGKFYIFSAAVSRGYVTLAVIGVLNSLVSVYYYIRVVVVMYMSAKPAEKFYFTYSVPAIIALIIAAWGTLQLGILPDRWLSLAKDSIFSFML